MHVMMRPPSRGKACVFAGVASFQSAVFNDNKRGVLGLRHASIIVDQQMGLHAKRAVSMEMAFSVIRTLGEDNSGLDCKGCLASLTCMKETSLIIHYWSACAGPR